MCKAGRILASHVSHVSQVVKWDTWEMRDTKFQPLCKLTGRRIRVPTQRHVFHDISFSSIMLDYITAAQLPDKAFAVQR